MITLATWIEYESSWYGRNQATHGQQHAMTADAASHARFTVLSPKMPVGRTMMITVKTRNVTSSE